MEQSDLDNELMSFVDDEVASSTEDVEQAEAWKVMIVDDEETIHTVTKLALRDFILHGRPLEFIHAYSGRESVELMRQHDDIAMILMDVVMESEHAGLDAVRQIREELGNHFVRIVLRTGQPGQAPEREVVSDYDINDYKEKTELTATKLYTLMHTGLSLYRELVGMDRSRTGLERVMKASAQIFELKSFSEFARGVLHQLGALVHAPGHNVIVHAGLAAQRNQEGRLAAMVGTGDYDQVDGNDADELLDSEAIACVREALYTGGPIIKPRHIAIHFSTHSGGDYVLYLATDTRVDADTAKFIELFCQNVALAFDNVALHDEVMQSQRQMITMLSSTIEERSPELRHHVARVSEYSRLLGKLAGLSGDEQELLSIGAAMHDVGKIAVREEVLNKNGKLTEAERAEMEQHVTRGEQLIEGQPGDMLKTAGIVIAQHHERWDGGGYPRGLKGQDIHLFGRVASIADVFDALTTTRCYKQPWPIQKVLDYFQEQQGQQFDPALCKLFLDNIDDFLKIKARYNPAASPMAAAA